MSEQVLQTMVNGSLAGARSVLDVGSYSGKYLGGFAGVTTAVEAMWKPLSANPARTRLCGDARQVLPLLRDGSFEIVLALDFIEHLEWPEAQRAIQEMQRIALRKVVLFTPHGFHEQRRGSPDTGHIPDEEWPWQEHRCGVDPSVLSSQHGFTVACMPFDYGKGAGMQRALWAEWAGPEWAP